MIKKINKEMCHSAIFFCLCGGGGGESMCNDGFTHFWYQNEQKMCKRMKINIYFK
jgi:hypothetical protein